MKAKFIDYYNLSSNLIFLSFFLGIIILFLRGIEDISDLVIASVILALRYFSVILIKRRFTIAKYLLVILIARTIYRLFGVTSLHGFQTLTIVLISVQLVLTVVALILIVRIPIVRDLKKKFEQAANSPNFR